MPVRAVSASSEHAGEPARAVAAAGTIAAAVQAMLTRRRSPATRQHVRSPPGMTPAPPPPTQLGEGVEAPVLGWQREAVSDPVGVVLP